MVPEDGQGTGLEEFEEKLNGLARTDDIQHTLVHYYCTPVVRKEC